MMKKDSLKGIWIDENGNTCVGIKPETPKKEQEVEVKANDEETKNVKSNRRTRSSK